MSAKLFFVISCLSVIVTSALMYKYIRRRNSLGMLLGLFIFSLCGFYSTVFAVFFCSLIGVEYKDSFHTGDIVENRGIYTIETTNAHRGAEAYLNSSNIIYNFPELFDSYGKLKPAYKDAVVSYKLVEKPLDSNLDAYLGSLFMLKPRSEIYDLEYSVVQVSNRR